MGRSGQVEGVILSRRSSGEADRVITLFTREQGVLKVIAKGVRRIPSRRGGHLEPFTQVAAVIRGLREYSWLAGVETINSFPALRFDETALLPARVITTLIMNVVAQGEPQPLLYQRLLKTWEVLPKASQRSRWLLEVGLVTTVLHVAGIFPALQRCTQCAASVCDDSVILDAKEGGWHCLTCHAGWAGATHSLSRHGLGLLQMFVTQPRHVFRMGVPEEVARQVVNAIRGYVSALIERPLPLAQDSDSVAHLYAR